LISGQKHQRQAFEVVGRKMMQILQSLLKYKRVVYTGSDGPPKTHHETRSAEVAFIFCRLAVKFRLFINLFNKQIRVLCIP
jgi:hypothetical protein